LAFGCSAKTTNLIAFQAIEYPYRFLEAISFYGEPGMICH